MSSTAPRVVAELATYFLKIDVIDGDRVVARREFATDDAAGVKAFLEEKAAGAPVETVRLSPVSAFAQLMPADEAATLRGADDVLARAAGLGGAGAKVAACDVVTGRIPIARGGSGWLLAGVSAEAEAEGKLAALGLAPGAAGPALPAELGAVARERARAGAEASAVVVWTPGEAGGKLWKVTAAGITGVREAPAGFTQIFEAVQAELGLKFRGAASKLFFNDGYDFGDAAERIGGRLGALLREGLAGETPAALHVTGVPAGQGWFTQALAKSLGLPVWTAGDAPVPGRAGGEWAPVWLKPGDSLGTKAPVAAPAVKADPAPVAAPAAKPLTKVAGLPAPVVVPVQPKTVAPKPVVTAPAVKPVAAAAVKSAVAQAPAKPAPAGRKPFPWVPLLSGAAVLMLVAGLAVRMLKSKPEPVKAVVTAAPESSPAAAPAMTAAVGVQTASAPALQAVLLESEVKRDPMGYRGEAYQFTVSKKGVLLNLQAEGRGTPWVRHLGFMRLYGVTTTADGARVARRAGDMNSPDYEARVVKRVRDGAVVFDVEVVHPAFSLMQTFVCLPRSVKVEVRFKPKALKDATGPLDAIYGVHYDAADFTKPGAVPVTRAGEVVYHTKAGELILRYEPAFKGAGEKPVVADPALTSFVLATAGGTTEQALNYEIVLP